MPCEFVRGAGNRSGSTYGESRMSALISRVTRAQAARARNVDSTAILGALPVPVMLLDTENRFRYVNNAAEQFLGISAASLAQFRLLDLLPPDNPIFLLIEQVRT